jgi:hypothetical protein
MFYILQYSHVDVVHIFIFGLYKSPAWWAKTPIYKQIILYFILWIIYYPPYQSKRLCQCHQASTWESQNSNLIFKSNSFHQQIYRKWLNVLLYFILWRTQILFENYYKALHIYTSIFECYRLQRVGIKWTIIHNHFFHSGMIHSPVHGKSSN